MVVLVVVVVVVLVVAVLATVLVVVVLVVPRVGVVVARVDVVVADEQCAARWSAFSRACCQRRNALRSFTDVCVRKYAVRSRAMCLR